MVMLRVGVMVVGKFAELLTTENEPTTHPQMHEEPFARCQVRLQEFGAARQTLNPLAFDARPEIWREGKAQVRAIELNPPNDPAFQHRREPAADRFNFWEFGDAKRLRFSVWETENSAAPNGYAVRFLGK